MATVISCQSCKHLYPHRPGLPRGCNAFPSGVPMWYASGDVEHTIPMGGEVDGILYTPVEARADAIDVMERLLGWRADAPKGGKSKKKRTEKAKCTKGRSCGLSCVPMSKKCKPGLSDAADVVAKSVASSGGGGGSGGQAQPDAPPPLFRRRDEVPSSESVAAANFKLLGSGIEGRVYLHPETGEALKYFNESRGALKEEFFGATQRAADVGIGPRLISVDPSTPVFSMEYLSGYEVGLNSSNLNAFLRNVKVAFDNDVPLDDLHEENIMSKGQDVRFIDLGGPTERASFATRANTLLNRQGWRTTTADAVQLEANSLPKAQQRELAKLQKAYKRSLEVGTETSNLSEPELEKMVNDVFSLLGI